MRAPDALRISGILETVKKPWEAVVSCVGGEGR